MAGLKRSGQPPLIPAGVSTSGGVILDVLIDRSGNVQSLALIHGSPDLGRAVTDAVKQWR